ncbi:hypothetical protein Tco_0687644 [Tanacetum coccineum]
MTKQKVVVGDGKSGLAVVPTALFTTDVKKPSLMPGGYIKISKKKLLQNLEITSGARINVWVGSMRGSSSTFNRQDKTTWMVISIFFVCLLDLIDINPQTRRQKNKRVLKKHGDTHRTYGTRVVPVFVLSLADVDPHFIMEDESLLWTSNDVVILLHHGSKKIPLK